MTSGNGTPKITIEAQELGPGWLLFHPGSAPPMHSDLSLFLNRAVMDWQREHPNFRVRATLPIVANGATAAIQVWYDEASN